MTPYEPLAPGTLIGGKYKVHRLIGVGGMGAVYLATQVDLGRKVAIKLLHPEFCTDPGVIERFHREAKLAASIGHDNICEVTDFGTSEEGIPYHIMPVLKGRSLSDVLRNDEMSCDRICDIMRQVLYALDAAHIAGVAHRDLKPDNIFIAQVGDRKDFVKLLDFGISKVIESGPTKELTQTGIVVGTPVYMAPEQARGDKNVDHRLDIYAAGVILYEALTGKRPHDGNSYNDILLRIVTESFLPPRSINPGIPRELEAVVLKAMARNPSERFIGAREMAEAIDRAMAMSRSHPARIDGSPSGNAAPRPVPVSVRKWLVPLLVVLLLLIVVAGIVVAVLWVKESQVPAHMTVSPLTAGKTHHAPARTMTSSSASGGQHPLEKSDTDAPPPTPQSPLLETVHAAPPQGMEKSAAVAPSGPAPERKRQTSYESAPAQAPKLLNEEAQTPSPTKLYTNMSQLKTALRQGEISRMEYHAHQVEMRKRRAAEYDRLKAAYRAGTITRDEYERQVVLVKQKYEGN